MDDYVGRTRKEVGVPDEVATRVHLGVCDKIKLAVDGSSLSRKEIGEQLGAAVTTVASWCNGYREPSVTRLVMLAAVLDVPFDSLLPDPELVLDPEYVQRKCPSCGRPEGMRI